MTAKRRHCEAIASSGSACRTPPRQGRPWCINHDPDYATQRSTNARRGAAASHASAALAVPEAVVRRDVREATWWAAEQLITGTMDDRRTGTLARLLRLAHALGDAPADSNEALAEVQLRGLIMQGNPPRTPAEWQLATRLFTAEALNEIRRWSGLPSAPDEPTAEPCTGKP